MGKKSPKSVNPNPDEFMREMEQEEIVDEILGHLFYVRQLASELRNVLEGSKSFVSNIGDEITVTVDMLDGMEHFKVVYADHSMGQSAGVAVNLIETEL